MYHKNTKAFELQNHTKCKNSLIRCSIWHFIWLSGYRYYIHLTAYFPRQPG